MISLVTLGVIAGVLAVDQRAGWQGLFAQPVFAAVFVGLVLGEPTTCMCVGLVLELIYLSVVPMRGTRAPDPVAAGVVGAASAAFVMGSGGAPDAGLACTVGTFFGLVAGEVGARGTAPLFALQSRFLGSVEFSSETTRSGMARRLLVLHALSVAFIFTVEGLTVLALGAAGQYASARAVRLADPGLALGAAYFGKLVPVMGVASIVHLFWHHRFRSVVLACGALVVIVLWLV